MHNTPYSDDDSQLMVLELVEYDLMFLTLQEAERIVRDHLKMRYENLTYAQILKIYSGTFDCVPEYQEPPNYEM
jgi:hypothetical protein